MHGTFQKIASQQSSLLDLRIAESNVVFSSLYDVHLGPVGQDFLAAINTCGVREVEAPDYQICDNVYVPFAWPDGFVNTISYKSHAFAPEAFIEARCHEALHAIAWSRVPVLHASLFNNASPVILSPYDWLRVFEMTEADVAAKTGWLMFLAAQHNPVFFESSRFSPVSAMDYAQLSGDTVAAIGTAANMALQKIWGRDNRDKKEMSFGEFYHWLALRDYERMLDFFEEQGIKPMVVKMNEGHFRDMGRSFGPNPFDCSSYDLLPIKPCELLRIEALNKKLGIVERVALPCFDTVFQQSGEDPYRFLAMSKGALVMQAVIGEPRVMAIA